MMRLAMALTVLLLATAGMAYGQRRSPAEVVEEFHAALARDDSAAALAVLDEDVVIFESGFAERSRDEYASHHLGADIAYAATTRRVVTHQTQVVDESLAIVLSEVSTTGQFRGRTVDQGGLETMVLRLTANGWRIVHVHWSSRRRQ